MGPSNSIMLSALPLDPAAASFRADSALDDDDDKDDCTSGTGEVEGVTSRDDDAILSPRLIVSLLVVGLL